LWDVYVLNKNLAINSPNCGILSKGLPEFLNKKLIMQENRSRSCSNLDQTGSQKQTTIKIVLKEKHNEEAFFG
jgi:hypothetical protein